MCLQMKRAAKLDTRDSKGGKGARRRMKSESSRLANRGGNDQLASESDHKPDQGTSMQTGASSRVFVCWAVVEAVVVYSVSRVVGGW